MKTAEEDCIAEDETAMDESVSMPDSREAESTASTMVDEDDHAIYADSDVDRNEPHQQGFALVAFSSRCIQEWRL